MVLGICRVEIHNVRNRDSAFYPVDEFNCIAILYFSLANHGEIKPGALALKETLHHVATIKSNPEFETWHSRLSHHELGRANTNAIADLHMVLENTFSG